MDYPFLTAAGYFSSDVLGHKKGIISPPRTVEEYEFELFTEDYEWGMLNGEQIPYKKNTVMIFRPGDVRCSKLDFCCYFIHIVVRDKSLCDYLDQLPICINVRDAENYIALFRDAAALFPQTENDSPFRLLSCFSALLASLEEEQNRDDEDQMQSHQDVVSVAKVYLSENLEKHISLSDVANYVHLSPNYFHTLFTRACGCSPLQYLTQTRMVKARYLLLTTAKTISEIADLCGFSTCHYFCSRFKTLYGIPPVKFRKTRGLYRI